MSDETASEQPNKADHLKKYRWPKGTSGNPKGRPVSPVNRIKEMFKENPEDFDEWLEGYINDKANKKHVVEMLDGKPKQSHEVEANVALQVVAPDAALERFNLNGGTDTETGRVSSEQE